MSTTSRKLFEFVDLDRSEPKKFSVEERRISFKEIYEPFERHDAAEQSKRCLDCGTPYCQWKCPVHNHIPVWLELAAQGRIFEAADLAHQTNSLPEVCGRVCPQDRLCEGACTLNDDFGAVTIGQAEKYIVDTALSQGWKPDLSEVDITDYKVAIVGAGPAGIACADVLSRAGIKAVVYDAYQEIGGLLTFGIPEFKLAKSVITRRRKILEEQGIEFVLNTRVGEDVSFQELYDGFDAVFLGMGTYTAMPANLDGQQAAGVHEALPFLIGNTNHLLELKDDNYPFINLKGKRVVVLGGGDTAMDCVRTSIRQGAAQVQCVYRRDEESMPGSRREVTHAKEEGVEFLFNLQPKSITTEDGAAKAVVCYKTEVVEENGRKKLIHNENDTQELVADAIIIAFGFLPSPGNWFDTFNIDLDEKGRVRVAQNAAKAFQTSNAKIFAGGDMVRGADLVVTAIAEGRDAGHAIIDYLDHKL